MRSVGHSLINLTMVACLVLVAPGKGYGQSTKPKGGVVPMTAAFRDSLSAPTDRIKSDGLGVYIDGVQKVKAFIESGGHLADFHVWLGNTKGVRRLFLDFSGCAPPDCSAPFAQGLVFHNTAMRTRKANLPGMAIGAAPVPAIFRLEFDAPDPATGEVKHWFLRFDPEDTDTDCQGSTVAISRPAADTWVIEADELDSACLLSQENTLTKDSPRQRGHAVPGDCEAEVATGYGHETKVCPRLLLGVLFLGSKRGPGPSLD